MKQPSMTFYVRDWEADENLAECTFAAHGLWIAMLCKMKREHARGRLVTVEDAPVRTADDLARMLRRPVDEVAEPFAELERKKVFSRDADGTIYSRRLVREALESVTNSENGKKGGRPRKADRFSGSESEALFPDGKAQWNGMERIGSGNGSGKEGMQGEERRLRAVPSATLRDTTNPDVQRMIRERLIEEERTRRIDPSAGIDSAELEQVRRQLATPQEPSAPPDSGSLRLAESVQERRARAPDERQLELDELVEVTSFDGGRVITADFGARRSHLSLAPGIRGEQADGGDPGGGVFERPPTLEPVDLAMSFIAGGARRRRRRRFARDGPSSQLALLFERARKADGVFDGADGDLRQESEGP